MNIKHTTYTLLIYISLLICGIIISRTSYEFTIQGDKSEIPAFKTVTAIVTNYTYRNTCEPSKCLTASGKKPQIGFIACPRELALGTVVEVLGTNYTCEDRTNIRLNGRYDIWNESYTDSMQFGRQQLLVTILNEED